MSGKVETPDVVILPDGRMDRKNAAVYLGLKVKTLAMYACCGIGPRYVKRGRIFYYRQDLDEWLRAGQRGRAPGMTGQAG